MVPQKEIEERKKGFDSQDKELSRSPEGLTRRVWVVRTVFVCVAAAFAVCVTIQVFLAGLAIFVHPMHWARHTSFVHTFEFLPLIMLLLSFVGRLPSKMPGRAPG